MQNIEEIPLIVKIGTFGTFVELNFGIVPECSISG